jgi:two-component system, OmpR family, KDP operon response regulator KdpE
MSASESLVLLIEDDPQVRRFLRTSLKAHGFAVLEAADGAAGLRDATQHLPEIVLLDLGLPDMDGIEVVQRLRTWSRVPLLILSARGEERRKVEALDAGADDYLTKPFGFAELLARMRAALRRARNPEGAEQSVLAHGPLRIDLARHRVELDGREVRLTPIEFRLLAVLARHAGRVVTHRQLLTEVWGPQSAAETQYLRVYLTHLRRKLEPDPVRGRIFHNEAGVGYRLEVASPPEPNP